jgi:leucyl aminopeptidase
MSHPVQIRFLPAEPEALLTHPGRIAVLADQAALSPALRRLDRAMKGALARALGSEAFGRLKPGEAMELAFPAGLQAEALQILRLPRRTDPAAARKAGAAIGKAHGPRPLIVLADGHPRAAEVSFGLALRAYSFDIYRTGETKSPGAVSFMVAQPEAVAAEAGPMAALAEGVFFTRDLVNEPANVLTTDDFAARLAAMQELGLEVEILEEEELAAGDAGAAGRGAGVGKPLEGGGDAMEGWPCRRGAAGAGRQGRLSSTPAASASSPAPAWKR